MTDLNAAIYGATYIVSAPTDENPIAPMYARLLPLAQAAGFDDLNIELAFSASGGGYSAHGIARGKTIKVVTLLGLYPQVHTAAEAEEGITEALCAIIDLDNNASL